MASILEIEQRGIKFDADNNGDTVDYSINHKKLVDMVDKYGDVETATATGMKISTVRQHYRDKSGKAMISDYRIKRAEYALKV